MEGTISDISLPNSSFFNIYNDGGQAMTRASPTPALLPGGQCNYVDLNHGANGPKCGCRRFWSRGASGTPTGYQGDPFEWCMCSHHACYHDEGPNQDGPAAVVPSAPPPPVVTAGQENERPKANREPLTPVIPDMSFHLLPPEEPEADFQTLNNASFSTNFYQEVHAPPGEDRTPAREPSLPDTLSWANFVQSQADCQPSPIPAIPSQCLQPSQPSSTTSSARMAYLRPFAGKGLQTFSGIRSKLREPIVENVDEVEPQVDDVVEPDVDPAADDLPTVTNTPRSVRRAETTDRQTLPPVTGPSLGEFQDLSHTVQSHEDRLNHLESASFSADGHADFHELHDQADLRITELEQRMVEVEKMLNDGGSVINSASGRSRGVDESTASVVSVSTDAGDQADRVELYNELQALKRRLNELQSSSSLASYTRPWEIEVIFLPFPLKGVWMESFEFSSQRPYDVDADQWTQLHNSSSTLEPQSPGGEGEWTGPDMEAEWLLPRACPPGRVIDKRLRSRGLVKSVLIRGPDARSVNHAITAAFGTLFRTFSRLQASGYHNSKTHGRVSKYLGLQQSWIPLRKIHKDSRLCFLSPAEMITPATWDASFLSSSVVMKSTGVHRLFITQPEAYLQDQESYHNGWSWQRLRELSRVYPDSQSSQQDVPEADAMEECWAWNEKLDEHPSSQASSQSLSLRQAAQPRLKSMSRSPSLQQFTRPTPSFSISRSRAQSPQVVLKERKQSRPQYVRTTSMPPSLPPIISPALSKRRAGSGSLANIHSYYGRSSPQLVRTSTSTAHAMFMSKRRRSSRSPSVAMSAKMMRHIPRWSSRSPSPMIGPFGPGPVAAARQTSPFYYATPYSNAPFVDTRPSRGVADLADPDDDDDRGSGTDSYDDVEPGPVTDDEDSDFEGDSAMLDLGHPRRHHDDTDNEHQLPEDEPWPGIEDEENRDPEALAFDSSEMVDVYVDEDAMSHTCAEAGEDAGDGLSQKSSVPSEYPSTQRAWVEGGMPEFKVFEDAGNNVAR